jgi:hypothetical protein
VFSLLYFLGYDTRAIAGFMIQELWKLYHRMTTHRCPCVEDSAKVWILLQQINQLHPEKPSHFADFMLSMLLYPPHSMELKPTIRQSKTDMVVYQQRSMLWGATHFAASQFQDANMDCLCQRVRVSNLVHNYHARFVSLDICTVYRYMDYFGACYRIPDLLGMTDWLQFNIHALIRSFKYPELNVHDTNPGLVSKVAQLMRGVVDHALEIQTKLRELAKPSEQALCEVSQQTQLPGVREQRDSLMRTVWLTVGALWRYFTSPVANIINYETTDQIVESVLMCIQDGGPNGIELVQVLCENSMCSPETLSTLDSIIYITQTYRPRIQLDSGTIQFTRFNAPDVTFDGEMERSIKQSCRELQNSSKCISSIYGSIIAIGDNYPAFIGDRKNREIRFDQSDKRFVVSLSRLQNTIDSLMMKFSTMCAETKKVDLGLDFVQYMCLQPNWILLTLFVEAMMVGIDIQVLPVQDFISLVYVCVQDSTMETQERAYKQACTFFELFATYCLGFQDELKQTDEQVKHAKKLGVISCIVHFWLQILEPTDPKKQMDTPTLRLLSKHSITMDTSVFENCAEIWKGLESTKKHASTIK